MANAKAWSERSGAERRRTFGRFAALYAAIAVVALAIGWNPVGIFFAIGALALAVGWWTTDASAAERADREKPDWLLAMDDPDAPDLSLPEYNRERLTGPESSPSPFDRPRESDHPPANGARTGPDEEFTPPNPPSEAPPSPGT